ncbi:amino acid/amide ABC transporter membrane protein 2, HAAT family [Roseovarius pacificus]|uniref:Amino acid/amide ABC transporter membrane protein 2, HAAT family n=1 Tax=Roseovarius pacificus TaxID=337701 RepID=A0A1M7KHG4_9RHOB|nr:branched-chain amino acid ABC transporter permease [Roseovarius pacificus]GGO62755.1 branched-chain amino acid ABC transporter permease [Roseovarius pacificus]SHM64745.1 amino acid/amide ABC transporter membrane protein 2, HAAT family [Roseovarius pacificus]
MADTLRLPYCAAGIAAAIGASLLVSDPYVASVVNLVSIAALIAVSLRFVMLIGELNFATAAFVGIGAYTTGSVLTIWDWPFGIAMISGGIAAAAVSVVFGYVTLRTKGPYFLLIGFAFTEAVRIIYSKSMGLGGNSGMVGIFPPIAFDPWMPTFVMSIAALLIFVLYVIEKSDFGKIFTAIRDNEDVARTVGLNILFVKVACFAIASFAAGVAGSLHAVVNNVISPGDFSFLLAAFALAYVKVGGEDNIVGPIVGAILLVVLGSYALGLGGHEHIFYGAAIVLAVLLMPEGVTGLLHKGRDFVMARGKRNAD